MKIIIKISLLTCIAIALTGNGRTFACGQRTLFMERICGIYKITNPKGKIYIGQSIDILKRKQRYQYPNIEISKQPKIHNSILKYGWAAHKFEIIHKCTPSELNGIEAYYTELFQCTGPNGLNIREGGGSKGATSEVTKEKLRQYYKNHPELREKLRLQGINNLAAYNRANRFRQSKIKPEDVVSIAIAYRDTDITTSQLAEQYKCDATTINSIVTGKTFPDIERPITIRGYKNNAKNFKK